MPRLNHKIKKTGPTYWNWMIFVIVSTLDIGIWQWTKNSNYDFDCLTFSENQLIHFALISEELAQTWNSHFHNLFSLARGHRNYFCWIVLRLSKFIFNLWSNLSNVLFIAFLKNNRCFCKKQFCFPIWQYIQIRRHHLVNTPV